MRLKDEAQISPQNKGSPRGKGLFERIFATYNDVSIKEAKNQKDLYGFNFHIQDFLHYNSKYPNYIANDDQENIAVLDPMNDFWF